MEKDWQARFKFSERRTISLNEPIFWTLDVFTPWVGAPLAILMILVWFTGSNKGLLLPQQERE